jgi:hypothetical protein
MRGRIVIAFLSAFLVCGASRANALTLHDVMELSKAGLSDTVLLALIDVDRSVFSIDSNTIKQLKTAGVSDTVIVALIKSGRTPQTSAAPPPAPVVVPPPPQVVEQEPMPPEPEPEPAPAAAVTYAVPVAVPVFVPVAVPSSHRRGRAVEVTHQPVPGSDGLSLVTPQVQTCVKTAPVYWGFGGKLRPGSWQPAPTVVCK